jgi:hypothetical protein
VSVVKKGKYAEIAYVIKEELLKTTKNIINAPYVALTTGNTFIPIL